uniref:Retrotransposon protein, putative, Ty3-gypsy subclass n=1 Tax=Ascaris lumbricoides TaxID=6252 RepID=A0A0M3I3J5_ASCLU
MMASSAPQDTKKNKWATIGPFVVADRARGANRVPTQTFVACCRVVWFGKPTKFSTMQLCAIVVCGTKGPYGFAHYERMGKRAFQRHKVFFFGGHSAASIDQSFRMEQTFYTKDHLLQRQFQRSWEGRSIGAASDHHAISFIETPPARFCLIVSRDCGDKYGGGMGSSRYGDGVGSGRYGGDRSSVRCGSGGNSCTYGPSRRGGGGDGRRGARRGGNGGSGGGARCGEGSGSGGGGGGGRGRRRAG